MSLTIDELEVVAKCAHKKAEGSDGLNVQLYKHKEVFLKQQLFYVSKLVDNVQKDHQLENSA